MPILSRPRRPRRLGEWTEAKAVTFIVTLAATQSVTLAARRASITRKSAYALKSRDRAFAAAWDAAIAAARPARRESDKAEEVDSPRFAAGQGDRLRTWKRRLTPDLEREIFFARLAATRAVAPKRPLP